jgi:hypothetical protein
MMDAGVDRSLAFTDVMEGNGKLKKKGEGDRTHLSVLRVEMLVGLRDCFLNVKFQFRQDDISLIPSAFFFIFT